MPCEGYGLNLRDGFGNDGEDESEEEAYKTQPVHVTDSVAAEDPLVDAGADEDETYSRYEPGTGYGAALFDARNAYCELNRHLMLWNTAHLWPKGSRFAYNRYRHWGKVFVRDKPGKPAIIIHSKEGIAQGCVLSMNLYGVSTLPLVHDMREAVPEALQPWFADDSGAAGEAVHAAACLEYLVVNGPRLGYFPEPAKSYYICKEEDEEVTRQAFREKGLTINFTRGRAYLGGFVGSAATKEEWLEDKIGTWTDAVETLAKIAVKYPQTAYAGFQFSLQNEWAYVSRVVADTAPFFNPLETAIRKYFIPALIGIGAHEVDAEYRELLSQSVKKGGLAIRNPLDSAAIVHETSKAATRHLVTSLVDEERDFDHNSHRISASIADVHSRKERMEREQDFLDARWVGKPAVERRDKRACKAGIHYSVVPSNLNGTSLSANEWRDNVRLRYNHIPLDMPSHCDGCGAKMTVEHALQCKCGGLVHIRHDDVGDEWGHLNGCASSNGRVTREPRIHSSVCRRTAEATTQGTAQAATTRRAAGATGTAQAATAGNAAGATGNDNNNQINGERGDVGVHGFWERGRPCIFDVRITDTDARSHRNKDVSKVLAAQEKEKKDKYLKTCHEMRKDFTPMVYSVDGIAGREARSAEKHLATALAVKWKKPYSEMVYYVRVRMNLAVIRANSLLIRGSRDCQKARRPVINDRASMYDWRTWNDR